MKPLTLNEILRVTQGKTVDRLRSCSISNVCIDSRVARIGDLFVAIVGDHHDGHEFVQQALSKGALYALVESGRRCAGERMAARLIQVDDTRVALGQIAAHHRRQLPANIVAVTGSNGKTTTKCMIHHVLSAIKTGRCAVKNFNNDIGVPLTLLAAEAGDEYVVVEIGTNAPGEVDQLAALCAPDVAVITGVGPAHLQGLKTIAGVANEKLSLLAHLKRRGLAVVNIDCQEVRERLAGLPDINLVSYGNCQQADLRITDVEQSQKPLRFRINDRFEVSLPTLGAHNAANAVAAFAVGRRFGMEPDEVIDRLECFDLPDMRLQMHQYGSMMVINDSYNANPSSMRGAIDALLHIKAPGRRVAIVGDMLELGECAELYHQELGRFIADSHIDVLLSVGEYSDVVCGTARTAHKQKLLTHASKNVDELAKSLPDWLKPRDTILLKGSRAVGLERLLDTIASN